MDELEGVDVIGKFNVFKHQINCVCSRFHLECLMSEGEILVVWNNNDIKPAQKVMFYIQILQHDSFIYPLSLLLLFLTNEVRCVDENSETENMVRFYALIKLCH